MSDEDDDDTSESFVAARGVKKKGNPNPKMPKRRKKFSNRTRHSVKDILRISQAKIERNRLSLTLDNCEAYQQANMQSGSLITKFAILTRNLCEGGTIP